MSHQCYSCQLVPFYKEEQKNPLKTQKLVTVQTKLKEKSRRLETWQFGSEVLYPSVGVFGRLVVVPDAESSDALGFTEGHAQRVGLSIGERNEPHVFVTGSDVDAVDEPGRRHGHQTM